MCVRTRGKKTGYVVHLFTFEMRAGPMTELTFSTAFRTPIIIKRPNIYYLLYVQMSRKTFWQIKL